jgi:hypothetical protein
MLSLNFYVFKLLDNKHALVNKISEEGEERHK